MNKKEYEEFIADLLCNDEFEFEYKGVEYGIMHNPPYVYIGWDPVSYDNTYGNKKYMQYSSISQLLNEFTIDGKKLDEIQSDIKWLYHYPEENQFQKKKKDKRKKSDSSDSETGESSYSDLKRSKDIKQCRSFFGKVSDIFKRIFSSRK